MNLIRFGFLATLVTLAACGNDTQTATVAPTSDAQPGSESNVLSEQAAPQGLALRVSPGGRTDSFCIPAWSIANHSVEDVSALMIQIAWHRKNGEILEDVGEFGTLQENLSAGRVVDRTLNGYVTACDQLKVVVGNYACRDENAVRKTCPGPVHVITEGGIEADVSGLQEGPMRGAMEP